MMILRNFVNWISESSLPLFSSLLQSNLAGPLMVESAGEGGGDIDLILWLWNVVGNVPAGLGAFVLFGS